MHAHTYTHMHAHIHNPLKCVSMRKVTPTPAVQTAAEENSGAAVFPSDFLDTFSCDEHGDSLWPESL